MGHSLICLPQVVHVTKCPQSSSTQSIGAAMHTLHKFSSLSSSTSAKITAIFYQEFESSDNMYF
jgi:hypothetical protein